MDRKYLLRIANYEYFIATYTYTGKPYKTPHKIIQELEEDVCYTDEHEGIIMISWKPWAEVLFKFNRIFSDGNNRFVVYDFDGFIS